MYKAENTYVKFIGYKLFNFFISVKKLQVLINLNSNNIIIMKFKLLTKKNANFDW